MRLFWGQDLDFYIMLDVHNLCLNFPISSLFVAYLVCIFFFGVGMASFKRSGGTTFYVVVSFC